MPILRLWVAIYSADSCGPTDITLLCLGLGKDNTNSTMAYHITQRVNIWTLCISAKFEIHGTMMGPRPIQL